MQSSVRKHDTESFYNLSWWTGPVYLTTGYGPCISYHWIRALSILPLDMGPEYLTTGYGPWVSYDWIRALSILPLDTGPVYLTTGYGPCVSYHWIRALSILRLDTGPDRVSYRWIRTQSIDIGPIMYLLYLRLCEFTQSICFSFIWEHRHGYVNTVFIWSEATFTMSTGWWLIWDKYTIII